MSIDSSTLQSIIESICIEDLDEQKIRHQITFYNSVMRELKKSSSEKSAFYKELAAKTFTKDSTLQNKFLLIESIIEKVSAERYLLLGKDSVLEEKLLRHTPLMEKDGNCLGLTSESRILLVGSGSIPITGIILCNKFACKIICVDSDPDAIKLSKKVISTIAMESQFTFICEDIRSMPSDKIDYTAAIIVAFLPHKNKILQKFLHSGHTMDLLIRQPRGPYSLIYDKADIQLINQMKNVRIDADLRRGHYSSIIGRIE